MIKLFTFFTILFLLNTNCLKSQTNTANFITDFAKAQSIFDKVYQGGKNEALSYYKGDFSVSRPLFLALYKQDSTNANLAFKIGVCYLNSPKERAMAIKYFNKAITSISDTYKESSYKERSAPLIAYKYLADAYHLNYEFDKAMQSYHKFIAVMVKSNTADKTLLEGANRKMEMCKTGKRLVANPVNIKIENLGKTVNSIYADYSPFLTADQNTLFFTSRRPESKGGQKDEAGNYFEDIYMSTKTKAGWLNATNIGTPINTNEHDATIGISPDGQTILIYKDDNGDGNIYSTSLKGDVWSIPVKLNVNINSKYWEPSAFISADGKTMYFTSDRPGGYGGRDLYISKRKLKGDWEKAVNMGPKINTPYDEDAPFIHHDGVNLTFSSNGHATMGGFDNFTSLLSNDGTWSDPINIGYPINTPDDDIFYVVSPDGLKAYYSSFRKEGLGEKDNYKATFLDKKETPLTLMKGTILDEKGKPAEVEITVTDNATEEIVGVYYTNSKTGQYLFILPPGKNYNITYQQENHLYYSENMDIPVETNYYELNRPITLPPMLVGSKITLNNIFFDFDKATLRPISSVEIKNLVNLMKRNPTMKVEIAGHTDNKGDDDYNLKLSDERAKAVVDKLIVSGVDASRLKAKGYGETVPVATNTKQNGADDAEGRQLNRRVELKITEIN